MSTNGKRYPRFRTEKRGRRWVAWVILKEEHERLPARWVKYGDWAYSFDMLHTIDRVLDRPQRILVIR